MLTDIAFVANEFGFQESQVVAVADLLAQDATIPFIARYRKEATGSLDEVAITAIRDRLAQLAQLNERKEAILRSLERNGVHHEQALVFHRPGTLDTDLHGSLLSLSLFPGDKQKPFPTDDSRQDG